MGYVDIDLVKESLLGWQPNLDDTQIEHMLDTLPIVEIVRCKDCVYWDQLPPETTEYPLTQESIYGNCYFLLYGNCASQSITEETHFCGHGDKREEIEHEKDSSF